MYHVYISDYSEILFSPQSCTIQIKWLPESRHMAEWEFREQLDELFRSAEIFKARIMYMDAYDFNYPVSEAMINLIKGFLTKCSIKTFGIVKSKSFSGKRSLLSLLCNTPFIGFELLLFDTPDDGKFWYVITVALKINAKDLA